MENQDPKRLERLAKSRERLRPKYIGAKYGRLTVKDLYHQIERGKPMLYLVCDCDCGTRDFAARAHKATTGQTKSCGCLLREWQTIKTDGWRKAQERKKEKYFVDGTSLYGLTEKSSKSNTGIKGVRYNAKIKKYTAHIRFRKKGIYLGSFKTLEEAKTAREEGEKKYFDPILKKHGLK